MTGSPDIVFRYESSLLEHWERLGERKPCADMKIHILYKHKQTCVYTIYI